jgi:hypothetical protein
MVHFMALASFWGCIYLSWWVDRLRGRIKRLEDRFK